MPILSEAGRVGKNLLNINNYKPKLTLIVMQKRHHCRFFPGEKSRRDITGNWVRETVVDRNIAHTSYFDWYMIAHKSSQGTTRPVRYTELQDEMELITHICFTFCRSTSPIAQVPAFMYADLLTVRGRAYISAREM